jgi:hypothetical protein
VMKYHWKQGFPIDKSAASLWMEVTPGCGAWNWHYGILKIALQSSSRKGFLLRFSPRMSSQRTLWWRALPLFLEMAPKRPADCSVLHLHILIHADQDSVVCLSRKLNSFN